MPLKKRSTVASTVTGNIVMSSRANAIDIHQLLINSFALHRQGQLEQAQAGYEQILAADPNHFDALQLMGAVLLEKKLHLPALNYLSRAVAIDHQNPVVHFNHGQVFEALGFFAEAITSYEKAINLQKDYVLALEKLIVCLCLTTQFEYALEMANRLVDLDPASAVSHFHQANALFELHQIKASLKSYEIALAINPSLAEVLYNYANALCANDDLERALSSYNEAISLKPDRADFYNNRGNLLFRLKRLDLAKSDYEKAFDINPKTPFLGGMLQYTKMATCDWCSFEVQKEMLCRQIANHETSCPPFPFLAFEDNPAAQQRCAATFAQAHFPPNSSLGEIGLRHNKDKIRIGYYSADFHRHATSYLIADLIESHDRDKFDIIAISLGRDAQDEMRTRLTSAFDEFIDVRHLSDRSVAALSREIGIDIAVDLNGYAAGRRTGIFAHRAAPIQVNYLGYPGTMGVNYIDYIVADNVLISSESSAFYSEKIVYLPDSYQCNDRKRMMPDKPLTRRALGLPEDGFVFCCFNNNFKIQPTTFDSWMRILLAVPNSVLWLFEDNPMAKGNLLLEAQLRGVSKDRLVFAQKLSHSDHLARHHVADLFIDTLPYNAHTTASDALWAGLPVLTLAGQSFASRVAASLLTAIGLPELITQTRGEFEALAIELATNPQLLKMMKNRLVDNRLNTPLFDTGRFTSALEQAYIEMMSRHCLGLKPQDIHISLD